MPRSRGFAGRPVRLGFRLNGIFRVRVGARVTNLSEIDNTVGNARSSAALLEKVAGAFGDPDLREIARWVGDHPDRLPHSAYIGRWRADIEADDRFREVRIDIDPAMMDPPQW